MSLEDEFCDIVKKARNGQGQSVSQLAETAHLLAENLEKLEKGHRLPHRSEVENIGAALSLKSSALEAVAIDGWIPQLSPDWVANWVTTVTGDIGGYEVKGYVLHDLERKEAVFIDTGFNAPAMLTVLKDRKLALKAVCLTHGHTDHAGGLDRILRDWEVPVFLGEGDFPLLPWKPDSGRVVIPTDGREISVGRLTVTCLATPGHTPGGYCYRMSEGKQKICFVGDTLFAGSIGRSNPFSLYAEHLRSVRERVLSLPGETVLLPGHGPATTVSEELINNPFGE